MCVTVGGGGDKNGSFGDDLADSFSFVLSTLSGSAWLEAEGGCELRSSSEGRSNTVSNSSSGMH